MWMHIPGIQLSGIAADNAEDAQMDRAIRIDGGFDSKQTDNGKMDMHIPSIQLPGVGADAV